MKPAPISLEHVLDRTLASLNKRAENRVTVRVRKQSGVV